MVDVEALIRKELVVLDPLPPGAEATGRTCKGGFGDRCAAVVGCLRLALPLRSR